MSQLYQHSHFIATNQGLYDGTTTIDALVNHGRFGLGTFHALEGELLTLNGKFYHCSKGTSIQEAKPSATLPWAALADFTRHKKEALIKDISSYKALEEVLLGLMQSSNYPFLFYMKGRFKNIVIGSVPQQKKPYPPIKDVIESSITVETGEVVAELVGFFAPEFMFPMKGKGFHLHCLSENKQYGGHVLDLTCCEASVTYEQLTAFHVELPPDEAYRKAKFSYYTPEEHVPEFADKLKYEEDKSVMGIDELIQLYEKQLPYHRNHIDEEEHFEANVVKLTTLLELLKNSEHHLESMSNDTLCALIQLIRRASEYMLSVKRECAFAIEYNNWGIHLIHTYAIEAVEREHMTLLNHLGFAYYFLTEMGDKTSSPLSKARAMFETVMAMNTDAHPDLWAYACIVLAQVELREHHVERARTLLTKAYSFYRHQEVINGFNHDEAIKGIEEDIEHLGTHLSREARDDKYQAMVVLGYLADVEQLSHAYDFSRQCYQQCIAFIKQYWGDDTLQSADLYCRLARLYYSMNQLTQAKIAYQMAYQIYEKINGKGHPKLQELSHVMKEIV